MYNYPIGRSKLECWRRYEDFDGLSNDFEGYSTDFKGFG